MLKLSGCPRLTWGRGQGSAHVAPVDMGSTKAQPESGRINDGVRVIPPLAASDPTGGPHFNPPRSDARGANLRIHSCR